MDMIEGDFVVVRIATTIAPRPPRRDAGLVKVENLILFDCILRRLPDPHGNRGWMNTTAMRDDAVSHDMSADMHVGIIRHSTDVIPAACAGMTNFHAARAEIDQFARLQAVVLRRYAKSDAEAAGVAYDATLEEDMARAESDQRRVDSYFSLRKALTRVWQLPV